MALIIEKYASEKVTLLRGPVVSDGKTTFIQSIGAKAIVMDVSHQSDFNSFGQDQNRKGFSVSPLDVPPALPARSVTARRNTTSGASAPAGTCPGGSWAGKSPSRELKGVCKLENLQEKSKDQERDAVSDVPARQLADFPTYKRIN